MSVKFHVITTAYNCEKYIPNCLKMLSLQTYDNWDGIVVDDMSTDKTVQIIKSHLPKKMTLVLNKKNIGSLANQVKIMPPDVFPDEDVIVKVDGDDWLYNRDSLKILSKYYENPDVWMTYGSFNYFPSGKRGVDPVPVPKDYDFRRSRWVMSHLRSFKYFLFKNILVEDLKSKEINDFYETSEDCAVMKPMAEMAGWEHIKYIKDVLYVYNSGNPLKDGRIHRSLQAKRGAEIYHSPSYKKRTKQELIDGIKER